MNLKSVKTAFTRFPLDVLLRLKFTLFFSFILAVTYLFFSNFTPFIPISVLEQYAFSLKNPFNLLTYFFMQISLNHLFINLGYILLFSSLVELVLKPRDCLILSCVSIVIPAFLYILSFPLNSLVGASTVGNAFLGASLVINPKKTFIAFALLFLLLSFIITPLISQNTVSLIQKEKTELGKLKSDFNEAVRQNDSEKQELLEPIIKKQERKTMSLEESFQQSQVTPTNPLLHLYSILTGAAFVLLFRRNKSAFRKFRRNKNAFRKK